MYKLTQGTDYSLIHPTICQHVCIVCSWPDEGTEAT